MKQSVTRQARARMWAAAAVVVLGAIVGVAVALRLPVVQAEPKTFELVEATIEHHAAELTMKLVREPGGEAMADTSWSIVSDSGDPVREVVGAYASMVLAEGEYTIIAKNRDKLYQRDFKVESGRSQEVELVASEAAADHADEAD